MVRSERWGESSASWMASRTPKHMPRLSASKTFIAGMLRLLHGLRLFDDLFQRLDILAEGLAPDQREAVFRARLSVHERLAHQDVAALFQRAHVHAQVAVRHPELLFQLLEAERLRG